MVFYLQIIIDTTGSMNIWIERLRKSLYEFVQMSSIVNFEQISIIEYKDYDDANPVRCSDWDELLSPAIMYFCDNLVAGGGGGFCECYKSALNFMLDNLPQRYDKNVDNVYVLHITDSSPHNNTKNIEQVFNSIDWTNIISTISDVPNFDTYTKSSMCKLDREGIKERKALNDNFVWETIIDKCKENSIIVNVISTHTDYLGCKLVSETNGHGNFADTFPNSALIDMFDTWFSDVNSKLSLEFRHNYNLLGTTCTITDKMFTIIHHIIYTDMMLLTHNEIFGKIWRKLCKQRKHPLRSTCIDDMTKNKMILSEENQIVFTEWLKQSYNNITEINADLLDIECIGIITYNADNNDNLCSQQIINMFHNLSFDHQKVIKQYIGRLSIVDSTTLKPNSIPLNLTPDKLFGYIFHMLCPGTLLDGRLMKRTLAMLCRHTVLDEIATTYLKDSIGTWLEYDFTTETNIYPGIFSLSYLMLLSKNKDILTNEEIDIVNRLLQLSMFKRILNMSINIKYDIRKSMDKEYPDYHKMCKTCNISRPLSLLDGDKCGYCSFDATPKVLQTEEKTYMAQCTTCECFYARDKGMYIIGNSTCHACTNGTEPSFKTCSKCDYKFIMYIDMPYGQCKSCILNLPIRKPEIKEKTVCFSSVFEQEILNDIMGFKCTNTKSLFNMYKTYEATEIKNFNSQDFYFNNHKITNMNEIFEKIHTSINSFYIEQDFCDLCHESNTMIIKSCGRKDCEQKLCSDCATSWYGENKKGQLINLRHMTCMFCNRNPTYKTIKRWGSNNIEKMQTLPVIDSTMYYAWCINCNSAKICGTRECGEMPPDFTNFTCDDCQTGKIEFKPCPNCNAETVLASGCSHITCECGAHWCYECGKEFTVGTIYKHMTDKHGGWFFNRAYRDGVNERVPYDQGYDTDEDY